MMERRTFLALIPGSLLAAPRPAEAQAGKVHRIALIASRAPPPTPVDQGLFFERLRELGWVYGRDVVAERRAYGDRNDQISDLAAELIRTGPVDVFVVEGAVDAGYVRQVTHAIPIVTSRAGDLVEAGLAASLARPGGNVTGIQTLQPQLAAKQLSLLKEAIPRLSRSGILFEGVQPGPIGLAFAHEAEVAAKALGIALQSLRINGANELDAAFAAFRAQRSGAVVVMRGAYLTTHMKTLVDIALKHRLPSISEPSNFARLGGLMSYGYDFRETQRSAAEIVDRILRGAKASEIPIQQATKFQFLINMKTAKALGLTIPPSLLLGADQEIG